MFVVYKLFKLFVKLAIKVVLIPFRLARKLVGVAGNDDEFDVEVESTSTASPSDTVNAGTSASTGTADPLTDSTLDGSTAAAATGTTTATTGGDTEPISRGAVDTLRWSGSLLADRPKLLAPALALGVLSVLVSGAAYVGDASPILFVGLVVQAVLSVAVAGFVAVVAAGELDGRHYSPGAAAYAVRDNFLSGAGVAVGLAVVAGAFAGLATMFGLAISPIFVVLVVPALYVFLRLSFAVPAVFVDHIGVGAAFGRSWTRTEGDLLTILGIVAATAALSVLRAVPIVGTIVATTLATPLWAASVTSLYVTAAPTRPDVGTEAPAGGATTEASASDTTVDASADEPVEPTGDSASEPAANQANTPVSDETAGSGIPEEDTPPTDEPEPNTADTTPEEPDESEESDADETADASTESASEPEPLPDDDAERATQLREAAKTGDASPEQVPVLVDLLDSDDPAIRRDAAEALGDLAVTHPDAATEALDALRDYRLDPNGDVSRAASAAIEKIQSET